MMELTVAWNKTKKKQKQNCVIKDNFCMNTENLHCKLASQSLNCNLVWSFFISVSFQPGVDNK